jgi:Mg-chelatase subunit ChlD
MRLSFIYPVFLWLLLLLPALWAFSLIIRRAGALRLSRFRFWALLTLRSVALIALVFALAGAQVVRPVDDLTVVFLIDASNSMAPAQRDQAIEYLNTALDHTARQGDKAAVVVFGRNAVVERAPAPLDNLNQLNSSIAAARTNIEEAIQLGIALFPADTQKRLVLLSDGRENEGRAAETARLAALRGIPIDIVELPSAIGTDVLIGALDAPDVVRENQEIALTAQIQSSIATTGRIELFADGERIGVETITIEAGTTFVPLQVSGGETGFRRFEVRLEAEGDTQPVNNRAAAFTTVQGPPRVLLIANNPEYAAPLQRALEAANARAEILPPNQVPALQAQLKQFAAIVLVDVPARDVPRALQTALPIYVRDQGGSLAMIGGMESFGAGGWRRSPVAPALPVELDPQDREERADLALALVIDRSGSMSESAGVGITKLMLAKEAVYQASLGLEQNDQIGVVAFDTLAEWVLPMQPLPGLADIEQALSRFGDGGGTDIRSGVAAAAEVLPVVDAKTKHVILLTDGMADSNYADLIDQMRANQVTITVVSIGADANPALEQIAERGGGRFYRVLNLADVPDIFLQETVTVAGRDIVEEAFTPARALPIPALRNINALPPLYGYNATEARQAARTILVAPDNQPILAQWQFGLGRSVAWTSDLKGQWARDWVAWSEFPRFVGGLLDLLLPPQQAEGIAFEVRTDGPQAILELTVQDQQGRFIEEAVVEGRLLDPNDEGRAIQLTQVGAGRYRAVVPADTPGVYLAQVAVVDSAGQSIGNANAGFVISYSPEYGLNSDRSSILTDLADLTEGRQTPDPAAVFAPTGQEVGAVREVAIPLLWLALLLWPFDIALRRLMLRWHAVTAPVTRLTAWLRRPRPEPAASSTLARLQSARARVQDRVLRQRPDFAPQDQPQRTTERTANERPSASGQAQAQRPAEPSRPPAPPSSPVQGDDAIAALLAAKQRARRGKRET